MTSQKQVWQLQNNVRNSNLSLFNGQILNPAIKEVSQHLQKRYTHREIAIKQEHKQRLSGTKSSIENSELISASLNQFKLKAYSY